MKQSKVAIRYAKSFLSLAKETGVVEATRNDMELVKSTVEQSKDFRMMLQSPIVSSDQKLKVVQRVFEGKISELSTKFIDIVVSKGRDKVLGDIAEEYVRICKEDAGIYQVEVVSAYPLTEDQRAKVMELANKMHNGTFELTEQIDSDLIGGFILRIGDQMIDTSLRKNLREMRQEFMDTPYISEQ